MSIIVNPHVDVRMSEGETGQRGLVVIAPVRGRGLQVHTVDPGAEPALFSALLAHTARGRAEALPTDLTAGERTRLREIGYLVDPTEVSARVTYACDLDGPEAEDLAGAHADPDVDREPLVVNPTLIQLGDAGPTRVMRGRLKLANPCRPDRSWLTVIPDQPTALRLFSFSAADTPELARLAPGARVPPGLSPALTRRLVAAGVVGPSSGMAARARRREAAAQRLGARLTADRRVILDAVIDPFQLGAIRRYYRALTEEGFLKFGDKDWPKRYFARYDPIAHFFHEQLAAVVSEIAGAPFKASFPFYAAYHPGSDLPAHRDRDQCVLSLSVQLDHDPEPPGPAPWPIYLQLSDETDPLPVTLRLGSGAMFFGQEVRHWRETLTEGWSSYWFLFYVPEAFDGPLD